MQTIFLNLTTTWWGITLLCIFSAFIWFALSALLYKQFFKRFYDIVLSGLAIIILSPLLLFLTIITAIKMKGNPFFTQLRPGKINKKTGKEKIFRLIKFRTMTNEKDEDGNLLPDEKRLNTYGKFLRSTSLDELPELFNIFIGQMSIVGPRPQLIKDLVFMSDEIRKRHTVRPGLTGLAQVSGRNNITWEQKFEYDLVYIKEVAFFKDIKFIFFTTANVIKRKNISREGTVTDVDFGQWLFNIDKIDLEVFEQKIEEVKNILEVSK